MNEEKIKFQKIRINDVVNDGGKQFELGKSWSDFFGFNEDDSNVSSKLVFKALLEEHRHLDGREINLLLGEVTSRGDRKAYSNNKGLSEIKDFFINQLKLSSTNCLNNDYFAIFKTKGNFYLYFVPNLLYTNFVELFHSADIEILPEQKEDVNNTVDKIYSVNRIIFGAPGTGKSFLLNNDCAELLGKFNVGDDNYERVTFHPDYSYANFVGTYKPIMIEHSSSQRLDADEQEVLNVLQDKDKSAQEQYDILRNNPSIRKSVIPILVSLCNDGAFQTSSDDGQNADYRTQINHGVNLRKYVQLKISEQKSSEISYEYVPGPFMRMYVKALRNSMNVENGTDTWKPFILIIEEINRANVAAVFGDIFQLLDRKNSVSEYPIQASEDIKKYLAKELGGSPENYAKIRIPDNMFIWATMNSADQGVFPMDTAFKRRWDFTYIGIDENDKELEGNLVWIGRDEPKLVEWNSLRKKINEFLANEKINEDKQLGPYFISKDIVVPTVGKEIEPKLFNEVFKHKVLMYLFDDAAKQKRGKLFEGIPAESSRYSKICEKFDEKGIYIFNSSIYDGVNIIKESKENTNIMNLDGYTP